MGVSERGQHSQRGCLHTILSSLITHYEIYTVERGGSHGDNGGRGVEATGCRGKGVAGFALLLATPSLLRRLRLQLLIAGGARAEDDVLLNERGSPH